MERAVIVERLKKDFEIRQKAPGFVGSLRALGGSGKKTVEALRGISFSLTKGEIVSFIGPNGAGKTTTLKILSGVLYPSSGFVQVLGFAPWERKSAFLSKLGLVMGQKNQLWWDLPASDTLELNRAIYELTDREYQKNSRELVELLEVENILATPVRRLSLGQRMRLELVAALIHRPEVVFFDEPTLGLDVVAQGKIRKFIRDYNQKHGATIIITSHNMNDLVGLSKRVIVIDKGSIFYDGQFNGLVQKYAPEKVIKITLTQKVSKSELLKIGQVKNYDYPQVELALKRNVAALAASELVQNFPVADITIEEESIEEVIRRVFKST